MDCSPPGSSVHGISQARILEWLPCPSPGDLPDPGIKHDSPALQGKPPKLLQGTLKPIQSSPLEITEQRGPQLVLKRKEAQHLHVKGCVNQLFTFLKEEFRDMVYKRSMYFS